MTDRPGREYPIGAAGVYWIKGSEVPPRITLTGTSGDVSFAESIDKDPANAVNITNAQNLAPPQVLRLPCDGSNYLMVTVVTPSGDLNLNIQGIYGK